MIDTKKSFDDRVDDRVIAELEPVDMDQMYDDMLDEQGGECHICKLYGGARILKEVDPIAYNCGYSDFTDSMSDQYEEMSDGQYYNVDEIDTIRGEVEDEIEEEENQEGE